MTTPAQPTSALGGVSRAWIEQIAEIARREGHALRAGTGPWIEVQSINTGRWMPLTLEGRAVGDCAFASLAARDAALAAIEARVSPSFFTAAERTRATAILDTLSDAARR